MTLAEDATYLVQVLLESALPVDVAAALNSADGALVVVQSLLVPVFHAQLLDSELVPQVQVLRLELRDALLQLPPQGRVKERKPGDIGHWLSAVAGLLVVGLQQDVGGDDLLPQARASGDVLPDLGQVLAIGPIIELGLPLLLVVEQIPGNLVGPSGELVLGIQAEDRDHLGLDVAPPLLPPLGLRRDRLAYLGLPGLPLLDLEGHSLSPLRLGCSLHRHIGRVIFIVI